MVNCEADVEKDYFAMSVSQPSISTRDRRRHAQGPSKRVRFSLLFLLCMGMLSGLLTACGGDAHLQQDAQQQQKSFEQALSHAQSVGVPNTLLQPIEKQQQDLQSSSAPWNFFDASIVDDYYRNLSQRYGALSIQTEGLIDSSTDRYRQQAVSDLDHLQSSLANKQKQNFPLDTLTKFYQQNMSQEQKAQYPKDYLAISANAKEALVTLNQMSTTLQKLQTLKDIIDLMKESKQDSSTLQKQYDGNYSEISKALKSQELTQVEKNIDKQTEQAAGSFQKLIPQLVKNKVDQYDTQVQQLKTYGVDNTQYQKVSGDLHTKGDSVKNLQDYLAFAKVYNSDLQGMQKDLTMGKASYEIKQFHQEVANWGGAHIYHNPYDGKDYWPDMGYMTKGIGEDLDRELSAASTLADYQQVLTDVENEAFHLQMYETDFNDKTPYTQSHATDIQLLQHYKLMGTQVIVVSFAEQALRLYENGVVVRSFQITAGRPELPAVPGLWSVMWRKTKTVFKSPYPKGSPYYYADTPINYAIMYHEGGYFLHDSWWRNDYGPGTQYFHRDSSGNTSADYGTHGCVNMPTDQAAWIYDHTSYNTSILMY